MSADRTVLGYEAKVRVNNTIFNVTSGSVQIARVVVDTSDSETGRKTANKAGKEQMSVSLQFNDATDVNPHSGPYSILADDTIKIKIWPRGNSDLETESYFYYCPKLVLSNFEIQFNSQNGQVSGSLSGVSNGTFTRPDEAA